MQRFAITLMVGLAFGSMACGGCDGAVKDDPEVCAADEKVNPINGECVPARESMPNNDIIGGDAGMTDASDSGPVDMWHNPFLDMEADVPESERCSPDLDSDRDGLTNECECDLNTDPARADTDDDGASDGYEDANKNCNYDVGQETNPRQPDTDNDGLLDGAERDAGTDPLDIDSDDDGVNDGAEASGCMNPLDPDTDGDGLPDDIEDTNLDGQLGTCVDHMWTAECAGNESNPCDADTDGDGTPDNEEAAFLGCTPDDTANLMDPQFVDSVTGDYKLALETAVSTGDVNGLKAHAFSDATNGYAGFIAALGKPAGANTPEAISSYVFQQIGAVFSGATQRATGRRIQTHDGFTATVSVVAELSGGLKADTVRDQILARLSGQQNVSHGATGNFSATSGGDPMLAVYQIVFRNSGDYIISLAAVPESDYLDLNAASGFLVDDVTGGTAIARSGEALENECVSYRNDQRAKVDFIWIIDGSGSMNEEIEDVKAYAAQFGNILTASNLDWRVAVTSASCFGIHDDPAVAADVKSLFDPSGQTGPCPAPPDTSMFPIPIPGPGQWVNGRICNDAFTTDVNAFTQCIDTVRQGLQSENTVTIGTAAVDRALPRSDTNPGKIRTDAAVVVISVTDEFDDLFQNKMGFRDAGQASDPPNDPTLGAGFDQTALDNVVQPFVDYFLRLEVGATVFGIYWIPGTQCDTASEAAAGIHTVVGRTGGTAGSVCQSDLTATLEQIATASAGIASGLRLRGVPVAPSIVTKVGQVSTGNIVELTRSRADGWDYDSTVNRVTFQGPNPPQTGDRVVIAYRRWEGSIRQCVDDVDCPREQKYRCVDGQCL